MGYLPEALLNYLARLGWGHGDDEIFSRDELIEKFSLEGVSKSAAVFNPEKLDWLNHHYIKTGDPQRLAGILNQVLVEKGIIEQPYPAEKMETLEEIVKCQQEKRKTMVEMAEMSTYFFESEVTIDEKAGKKNLKESSLPLLEKLNSKFDALQDFNVETVQKVFEEIMAEKEMKLGKIAQPLRVALTGGSVSPGIFELVAILGKDTVLKRIANAMEYINQRGSDPA